MIVKIHVKRIVLNKSTTNILISMFEKNDVKSNKDSLSSTHQENKFNLQKNLTPQ